MLKCWSIKNQRSVVSCKTMYQWVTIKCRLISNEISFICALLYYNINLVDATHMIQPISMDTFLPYAQQKYFIAYHVRSL